jgi:outer membrane protein OmpA-like peptidoglycan-associated protein
MRRNRSWTIAVTVLLAWLTLATLHALDNSQKVKIRGLITGRTGETLKVKTPDGNVTVVLTDDTKVRKPKGLGLRKTEMSFTALIPGLKVSVDGFHDEQNRLVAETITFSGDDLQTAESIQAGLTPTQNAVEANQENIAANKVQIAANREKIGANEQQIAANEQEIQDVSKRFSDLSEFDTKGEATIFFASGSKSIPSKDRTALTELSRNAVNLTGYLIEVRGYADSSGNAAMNQKLSMDRAQEVVAFLIQNCNVPVRRIVAPGAMGAADPAATNETAQGRSQNRRVEVKVLVNRGLAGEGDM